MQSCFRALRTSAACRCLHTAPTHASSASNIVDELTSRGLVAAVTSRAIRAHLDKSRQIYLGLDPTAVSLHLGNLVTLIGLLHFQLHGHDITALVGGATGAIGDPSGRSTERVALSRDVLQDNSRQIASQITGFFEHAVPFALSRQREVRTLGHFTIRNNMEWLGKTSLIDFLSTAGKQARVASMLSRDSVKNRLSSTAGISFTEFTYNLLQAYDFQHLHHDAGITVQIGGSDQYGNIMAGVEMFQRSLDGERQSTEDERIFGLTMPLLTTSCGQKFGKSAGNAIWLSDQLTSPYEVYQYFLRAADTDVGTYLKTFTFLPVDELDAMLAEHARDPARRLAQTALAKEATELIHGVTGLSRAELATSILFNPQSIRDDMADDVVTALPAEMVKALRPEQVVGQKLSVIATRVGLTTSKKAARLLMTSGGLGIYGEIFKDPETVIDSRHLRANRLLLLQSGKTKFKAIVVDESAPLAQTDLPSVE